MREINKGNIFAYTIYYEPARVPPEYQEQVPYVIALVDTNKAGRLTAMITDLIWNKQEEIIEGESRRVLVPEIEIGMPVEETFRKLRTDGQAGTIIYGYKFRPILTQEA